MDIYRTGNEVGTLLSLPYTPARKGARTHEEAGAARTNHRFVSPHGPMGRSWTPASHRDSRKPNACAG